MKPGRPSKITQEILDRVIDGLSDGISMLDICEQSGMPNRSTIQRYADANEEFAARIARARAIGQDVEMERCIRMADDATVENWQVQRLKIWARQWRASKIAPKQYGDKVQQEISGPEGQPVQQELTIRLVRAEKQG